MGWYAHSTDHGAVTASIGAVNESSSSGRRLDPNRRKKLNANSQLTVQEAFGLPTLAESLFGNAVSVSVAA